jgi:hypothetical protein
MWAQSTKKRNRNSTSGIKIAASQVWGTKAVTTLSWLSVAIHQTTKGAALVMV